MHKANEKQAISAHDASVSPNRRYADRHGVVKPSIQRPSDDKRFQSWEYVFANEDGDDEAPQYELRPYFRRAASALARLGRWFKKHLAPCLVVLATLLVLALGAFVYWEVKSSIFEANYLANMAPKLTYTMGKGKSDHVIFPTEGPYDIRLGYTGIPQFVDRLASDGFAISSQVRLSPELQSLTERGLYPIYQEKATHGLKILGAAGNTLSQEVFPEVTYTSLKEVPLLVVSSLLFIEDRQVLDETRAPTLNPAIAWGRMTKASLELVLDKIFHDRNVPGGSTLATQIEKFRHSYEGRTRHSKDKLRQVASASTRAYQLGRDTRNYRERVVLDYINSVPLGAASGFGEVVGLADGLKAWYGIGLNSINADLALTPKSNDKAGRMQKALAFKRVLALFLSQRRPAYYLQQNQADLEALANQHVNLMAEAGVIDQDLRQDALSLSLQLLPANAVRKQASASFIERKATNAVRLELKNRLGVKSLYELDRLDLDVKTGYDPAMQAGVTNFLMSLKTPEGAAKAGLLGERLLQLKQAPHVNYSFTLMETVGDHNVIRVQTDTVNSPLDINGGGKLELGSTAKLRTSITYLDLVSELHANYANKDKDALTAALAKVADEDEISRWALGYLLDTKVDHSLPAMLESAMQRRYSASPWYNFWTGGSFMRFSNFNPDDNELDLTVAQAFQRSNNLVFVRLMRDIVQHIIMTRIDGADAMLKDGMHPLRRLYLERFVTKESADFLRRHYRELQPLTPAQRLAKLMESPSKHPVPLKKEVALLLSAEPSMSYFDLRWRLFKTAPKGIMRKEKEIVPLWTQLRPSVMSLNDRAYVAKTHPMALWLLPYLAANPKASFERALHDSYEARFASYDWLLKKGTRLKQDRAIMTVLERDAFKLILPYWKRQGFPFDYMTPSYASALGSSCDRPLALAELMGALLNKGVKLPTERVSELRFAKGTPFDTQLERQRQGGQRYVSEAVAAVMRKATLSVVDGGTAVRLRGAFKRDDGSLIPIAAKTGTGDNRLNVYGPGGRLVMSQAKSRTATLVFSIGDRFFGTVTAYVKPEDDESEKQSEHVDSFSFTSTLVAQVMKGLVPQLEKSVLAAEDPWYISSN